MTAELWHEGDHDLVTHDLTLTAGFWGSLGFEIELLDTGVSLTLGGVELTYVEAARLDPWWPGLAVVSIAVTNADLLHAEIYEADVMPDLTGPGPGDPGELQARWDADRDVSRLGVLHDSGHGTRQFVVFDPTNNQFTLGHPL